jgi:3-oxoadipate enol-lactonase
MPRIEISKGHCIQYIDENPSGERWICLLHGLGVNASSWQLQMPTLIQAGFRVIAPDLPGFGQSDYTGFNSIHQLGSSVAEFLQKFPVNHFILMGISLGGMLGLQIALDYPKLVERLILVNAMAKFELGSPKLWPYYFYRFILVNTLGLDYQARYVAKKLFPRSGDENIRQILIEQVKQADPQGYRAAMRAIVRFNVLQRLKEIECPTLIITGEYDTTIPPENQRCLKEEIQSSTQIILPDAGHAACIDQPEAFNQAILDFLSHPQQVYRDHIMEAV